MLSGCPKTPHTKNNLYSYIMNIAPYKRKIYVKKRKSCLGINEHKQLSIPINYMFSILCNTTS